MTTLKSERDGTTSFNHTTLMALVVFYTPLMTVVVHVGLLHYPDGCGGLFTTLMAVKVSPTTPMAVKVDTVVQRAESRGPRREEEEGDEEPR